MEYAPGPVPLIIEPPSKVQAKVAPASTGPEYAIAGFAVALVLTLVHAVVGKVKSIFAAAFTIIETVVIVDVQPF
jgi:hypothetical protein